MTLSSYLASASVALTIAHMATKTAGTPEIRHKQSVHTVTLAIHQQRAAEQRLMLSVVQYVINLKTIIYLPKILCLCLYRRPWWAEQLNYFPLGGSRGLFIYFLKRLLKEDFCVFVQFLKVYQCCVQINRPRSATRTSLHLITKKKKLVKHVAAF